ncbi:MAG: hypothetical protein M1832_005920 [Thelocarpon impressellum]|nr:MAG: hypothetical protein M1832_005920 [Thelocarpon impressellum]
MPPLAPLPLSAYPGISQKQVDCPSAGLSVHILEAGYDAAGERPLLLLLHGFPELAYSWRKLMPGLVTAGYYVVAPDCRGYGRTSGWDTSEFMDVDMDGFRFMRLVRDAVVLVHALGYSRVECVVGHDFGAVAASLCALTRPDMFRSVVTMSHPFSGPPSLPFNTVHHSKKSPRKAKDRDIHDDLANLPEPRKHYKWYNSTPSAARDYLEPVDSLPDFLRAYYHVKSAEWPGNAPHPLRSWSASELAKMPYYYVMPLDASMREAVDVMPLVERTLSQTDRWLPPDELAVYADEFARTGFQGALNWYRIATSPEHTSDLLMYAGAKVTVPALFVAGEKDWGTYQEPGTVDRLAENCTAFRGLKMVAGAGHCVQQERPDEVLAELLSFLEKERPRPKDV